MSQSHTEAWRKRHALQIAAQLPENQEDAEAVLNYTRELLIGFMKERSAERDQRALRTFRAAGGESAPNLRAISNDKASARPR
jgi:hypothetical protein